MYSLLVETFCEPLIAQGVDDEEDKVRYKVEGAAITLS